MFHHLSKQFSTVPSVYMEDQDEKNARSLKTMSENIRTISRDVSGLKKEISNFQNTYQVCAEIEFALNNVKDNSGLDATQKISYNF